MNSGELTVDVPLATVESDCEDSLESNRSQQNQLQQDNKMTVQSRHASGGSTNSLGNAKKSTTIKKPGLRFNLEGAGGDSVTGSLEDLVNSFDEKLSQCFRDYQEQAEKIAPVQVRSQEEIMNECQVWWTITGNFGNMMPIDWSKSTTRAKQLPTLNLRPPKPLANFQPGGFTNRRFGGAGFPDEEEMPGLEEEDDIVAADLDMHSLILTSNPQDHADPVKSADEVIKEIDDLIEEGDDEEEDLGEIGGQTALENARSLMPSLPHSSQIVSQALRGRKLEDLTTNELSQILNDIELLVRELSEELVNDLGVRDELEYEKELKNTFISLLLSIQSRRRQCAAAATTGGNSAIEAPKGPGLGRPTPPGGPYKYLTTVIPYQPEKGAPCLQTLQVLVKILKAINEDSPAVPALLTDYILKVLCPS